MGTYNKFPFRAIQVYHYHIRTLIDSTAGVLQGWKTIAIDYKLKEDPIALAQATLGRRLYDSLREYCGITDENHLLVCRQYLLGD